MSSFIRLGKPKKLALGNSSDVIADLPLNKVRQRSASFTPFGDLQATDRSNILFIGMLARDYLNARSRLIKEAPC